jgi:hypothetical protein
VITVFHSNGLEAQYNEAVIYEIHNSGHLSLFKADHVTTVAVFAPGVWTYFEKTVD